MSRFDISNLIRLNKFKIMMIGAKVIRISISVNLKKSFTYLLITLFFYTYTPLSFNQKYKSVFYYLP